MNILPLDQITKPENVGIDSVRLERACAALDGWVSSSKTPGYGFVALRRGQVIARRFGGNASADQSEQSPRPISAETIFLLASITKPMVATVFLTLLEEGLVVLDDPVTRFLPEFGKLGRDAVRVRHLLTHTSGLPDMVSNNESIRKAHHSLPFFVRSAMRQELGFAPGARVSYSSMGILLLSEIAERVAHRTIGELLRERVFEPLGMEVACLRPAESLYPRIAKLRLIDIKMASNWDNNSPYWRQLGAPWGGCFATADDVARFGQGVLESLKPPKPSPTDEPHEVTSKRPIIGLATAKTMVRNQTRGLPVAANTSESWGLGWSLRANDEGHWVGDLASPESFGHIGASGTMLWIDPAQEMVCVVLTNQATNWSKEGRRFAAFSNALQASIIN